MGKFIVTFWKDGKKVCSSTRQAESADDAMLDAGFSLACHFPHVEYDDVTVVEAE